MKKEHSGPLILSVTHEKKPNNKYKYHSALFLQDILILSFQKILSSHKAVYIFV